MLRQLTTIKEVCENSCLISIVFPLGLRIREMSVLSPSWTVTVWNENEFFFRQPPGGTHGRRLEYIYFFVSNHRHRLSDDAHLTESLASLSDAYSRPIFCSKNGRKVPVNETDKIRKKKTKKNGDIFEWTQTHDAREPPTWPPPTCCKFFFF